MDAEVCIVFRTATGCTATGTLWRPVDVSSESESSERATALNGVLCATTDRKFLHQTPCLLHSAPRMLRCTDAADVVDWSPCQVSCWSARTGPGRSIALGCAVVWVARLGTDLTRVWLAADRPPGARPG